ncbi:LLM class flavin-dependent oxidoreductase [Labedaea rhizosphaerae]|uniref:Alkanesulfonate monooxygenase SsuD/methylene tetrahydromethanopterin reductase-like flavin-dependent oxidoreductase (Luciferase family) n=1 Tax=Labedaea rhizosphaerae TaxID=598644 RepID=A0A4R6SI37_LABRH|nr:LLM class flavin-dependent oxidoreductase [Labedaea rhizosphaerae]TDQ01046.1 alkanesulfonate monooxygenase SsuD/methylene tetrahydromethanopterin reductase-like flavin-dependent oxidoreductase (luciferase family) [Labedaea rhizosphaerae]
MRVGIGLPNTTPGTSGRLIAEWARRADAGPFGTLGVLDRLVYASVEPFSALSAAAAVTERVGLATMIAIGPVRGTAMLAKQAQSVQTLSDGRFTLGVAVGARRDDYEAAGVEHRTRGAVLSEQLAHLRAENADVPILVGGNSGAAFSRMARYADGYAHGGGPARAFASAAAKARAAWHDLGRPGRPKLWGQAYFALGDADLTAKGEAYLLDYYAFTGPFAQTVAAANLTTPRAVKDLVRGYANEGCDELILLPTVSSVDQVDRLAEVLG